MDNRVRISVAMGVYRPRDFSRLYQAVESLMAQTFPHWELLLYDDGSPSPYSGAIRRAAGLDPRVRYLRGEENRGLAFALNQCLAHSQGEYLARLDDDDACAPRRLEKQLAFLEAHPQYQWVGSNAELMDAGGVWGLQKMPEIPEKRDFLFNSPYLHPTVLFRREALAQAGGYDPSPRYRLCEDYELFFRLHQRGMRGYNLQEPLLRYWEDYASQRRRTYRRRLRELRLRYRGFRQLGILGPGTFCYVLKPLAVGAVPAPVHHTVRRWQKGGLL